MCHDKSYGYESYKGSYDGCGCSSCLLKYKSSYKSSCGCGSYGCDGSCGYKYQYGYVRGGYGYGGYGCGSYGCGSSCGCGSHKRYKRKHRKCKC